MRGFSLAHSYGSELDACRLVQLVPRKEVGSYAAVHWRVRDGENLLHALRLGKYSLTELPSRLWFGVNYPCRPCPFSKAMITTDEYVCTFHISRV